jgi:hypothetical protein
MRSLNDQVETNVSTSIRVTVMTHPPYTVPIIPRPFPVHWGQTAYLSPPILLSRRRQDFLIDKVLRVTSNYLTGKVIVMSFLNARHLRNTLSRELCHLHSEGPEPRVPLFLPTTCDHMAIQTGNVPDCGGEQAYILAFSYSHL